MKKKFELPVIDITDFSDESVLAVSGNVGKMQDKMERDGYAVTVFSLDGFCFWLIVSGRYDWL